jgi:hypothetical protein
MKTATNAILGPSAGEFTSTAKLNHHDRLAGKAANPLKKLGYPAQIKLADQTVPKFWG